MHTGIPRPLNPLIYVSYAWGDDSPGGMEREQIVDELCNTLKNHDDIHVCRDKQTQRIGDSIEQFAANLSRADLLLAVVSKKYLRSYHCMVEELYQMYCRTFRWRDEFKTKVCLLLLDDGKADICISDELIQYWEIYIDKENARLNKLDPFKIYSPYSWQNLQNTKEMLSGISDMLSALKDCIMPRGYNEIRRCDFDEIRGLIRKRIQAWYQWRCETGGLATEIKNTTLLEPNPVLNEDSCRFLAIVLQRGEELVEDDEWFKRDRPWEVRSYSWEALVYDPTTSSYRNQHFTADVGGYLVASTHLTSNAAGAITRSSFADVLQAAVQWLDEQPNYTSTTLELFVPTELLGFDWAGVKLKGKNDYDEEEDLFKRYAFTLRSVDRFCDPKLTAQRSCLPLKYEHLLSGKGCWITGPNSCQPDSLREVEQQHHLVALKHLLPLDPTPLGRLRWHRRVVEAMLPLAIWWRTPVPASDEECQAHLDNVYNGLLSGKEDGDPIPLNRCDLDSLPRLRRIRITDPLTRDLVLLIDHPDRHPWHDSTPTRAL
jgi:hypothetical protein